jgi:ankyrin repeat protein
MSAHLAVARLARMQQPADLRSEEYQHWWRGRGVDVWAMLCAVIRGDLAAVRELASRDPGLVECEFEYLRPVHFAVKENRREVLEYLFEQGGGFAFEVGDSLLETARMRGHTGVTALLEAKLAERYRVSPEGDEIAAAIKERDAARVRALLEANPALVHTADARGNQPIHWAVMTRQRELIDDLLARGADINAPRPDGLRPVHITNGDYHYRGWRDLPATALQRHEVLIGFLLARGAYYDLATATRLGDLDRVRELLDAQPELVNQVPAYSYYTGPPLRNAAAGGHLEVVRLLLERGANPNQPEPGIAPQGGALHSAIGGRHTAVVRLLIEHGANPNAAVESSGNCLFMAKHVDAPQELKELLIAHGAVMGAELADLETLGAMLHANPNLEVGEKIDNPPLMELILRYQPDSLQRTPDPAPWWSHALPASPDYARRLFARGLDPNRANWLGITMLHRAAARGAIPMAEVLLESGAAIDPVETHWSSTPLGWAAREGKLDMAAWLLEKGANPRLPEEEPWAQPQAWARRRGHAEIVRLLG